MSATSPRTARRIPLLIALVVAGTLTAACDDSLSEPPSAFPHVTDVEVIDDLGPIVRSLRVSLEDTAAIEVFYEPLDGGDRTFRMTSDPDLSHEILMPRLLADTDYRFAVRVFDGGAAADSVARGSFTTGPLPVDLQSMDFTVEGQGTFPLLLFRHHVDGGFRGHIGMEPDGSIVWYTTAVAGGRAATPIPGSHDMLLITGEGVDGISRISPSGEIVQSLHRSRISDSLHHDIATLDEHRVLIITIDNRTVRDTVIAGEAVWLWDMEAESVEKVWSAWDHFDWDMDRGPRSRPDDWLHANAISVGPRGNLIISFHFLDQIISVAPDYQSVEWRLGGTNATIGVSDEDQFRGQHSAFELDDGNILLFDNQFRSRNEAPAEYSRGLELEIEGDSASVAWEYIPDPPVWARIISGIYPLDNGHRVVTFATPPSLFTVHEADQDGQRVWSLSGDDLTVTFRAVPWPSIAGEERVASMP